MKALVVAIPAGRIVDWESFHDVFAQAMGFPAYYGRNMDAWIDCMSYADEADAGMVTPTVNPGEMLTLRLDGAADFATRCPDQFNALVECTAFVNLRRLNVGEPPFLSLLLSGHFPPN